MALICLIIVPFNLVSNWYSIKVMQGAMAMSSDMMKEANLLLGDAVINYKTV
jgi:hypothetical protein